MHPTTEGAWCHICANQYAISSGGAKNPARVTAPEPLVHNRPPERVAPGVAFSADSLIRFRQKQRAEFVRRFKSPVIFAAVVVLVLTLALLLPISEFIAALMGDRLEWYWFPTSDYLSSPGNAI